MQTMGLRVRVATDACVVEQMLRGLPADLLRGPFQQAGWIDVWLAIRAEARPAIALAVVAPEADDAPVFVLPLMLDTRSGVPCWTALDDGVCDYVAPIFAADFAPRPETMRWIWARILDQLPNADLVFLEKISERVGDRRNPLLDLAQPAPSRFRRHPLALGDGLDAVRARYRAGRSLARKHRKLARKGRLDFAVLTGSEAAGEIDGLMAWRDRRHDARPITTAFYRRLLADTDLARVGLLRLDGRAISGCFAIVCDGALRLLVVAFDERWKNWSPGLLAIDEMIGWAAGEGLAEFDFTIGSEPYKFDFGVETEPLWEIREPLGLRGSVMLRLLGARRAAADLVRRTLPSLAAVHARRHGEHPTPPLPPAP